MRHIVIFLLVFISLKVNAQAEMMIVSSAIQDARNLISQEKYHQARQRLKDVEVFRIYEDSIKYFYDRINSLEGMYDHEGKIASSGLKIVVRKGKFGYVDASGREIIPIKYDYEKGIIRNGKYTNVTDGEYVENWHDFYVLVRVKFNGKYGFVNQKGREIVAPKYEETDQAYFWSRDDVVRVKIGNNYGLINYKGEEIVPCIYEDARGWRLSECTPFVVKKDGKYGYVDRNGKLLTDFRYSSADYSFGYDISKKLAVVCRNGMYGYINEKCEEAIPLQYQFADTFYEGLAAVVKDNKVGFINENGVEVIPCQYEVHYSNYSDGKKGLTWNSFEGGNAVLKKNGKWGIIDKQGNSVTEFKYDGCNSISSIANYEMTCEGRVVYVDIVGKEYPTEEKRSEQSSKSMLEAAEKGNPEAQWYVSWNYDDGEYGQDLIKSYEWCLKAANAGVRGAWDGLGEKYYYGKGCEKNYSDAFLWFHKAAESGMLNSCYFLGWMYEHGQGCPRDMELSVKYYKQAAMKGHQDSIKRLAFLNINTDEF